MTQTQRPGLTHILIAINAVVFIRGTISAGTLWPTKTTQFDVDYGEVGLLIGLDNEWWRLFTGGFLHSGIAHVVFNMLLLWMLGRPLESLLGVSRFFFLYFGALLAGAFGVMVWEYDSPSVVTVGASGAIFGLMAAVLVLSRLFGGQINISGLVFLLLINLLLTFTVPGISVGGHLGGMVGGALIGVCYLLIYRLAQAGYFRALQVAGGGGGGGGGGAVGGVAPGQIFARFRRWEVALSCVVAGALAAGFFFGAWWLAEESAQAWQSRRVFILAPVAAAAGAEAAGWF